MARAGVGRHDAPEVQRSRAVEPLDVVSALVAYESPRAVSHEFYDRLCEALARLGGMDRAVVLLGDDSSPQMRVGGSYGVPGAALPDVDVTVARLPFVVRAARRGQPVQIDATSDSALPREYVGTFGLSTLACIPLLNARGCLGAILADRNGAPFELGPAERSALRSAGKAAALALSARLVASEQERARRLDERLALAGEIHDRVMQRLFGVSMALAAGDDLTQPQRERCKREMARALTDLRRALERPPETRATERESTLRAEVQRVARSRDLPATVRWDEGVEIPPSLEPLAQSVLAEAVRNCRKHADPSAVEVVVDARDGLLTLEVRNDGLRPATGSSRFGLRLLAARAVARGGFVQYGRTAEDHWRVRLTVPLEEGDEDAR